MPIKIQKKTNLESILNSQNTVLLFQACIDKMIAKVDWNNNREA